MTETDQQARYDLTLVRLRPRTVPAALERLNGSLLQAGVKSELVACLFSEIGTVNQILLLRRYSGAEALLHARDLIVRDSDPLGISEFAVSLSMDLCVALPGNSDIGASPRGPFFEVRIDVPRPGGLGRAFDLWHAAVAGAEPLRPMFGGYTVAGDVLRMVHIWPWSSLENRADVADDACHANIWADAEYYVTSQRAEIFRAAPFSPIQ